MRLFKILGAAAIGVLTIQAGNLITNGTFEGGSIAGWTAVSTPFPTTTGSCNDGFAAQTTASGCTTGLNPVSGSFAAYASTTFPTGDTGEWINYLNQNFVVPTNVTSATLNWSDSAVWSGTGGFRGVDVLAQLYLGATFLGNQYSVTNPSSNGQLPWTAETWNVTSILQANPGATLTLKLTALAFPANSSSTVSLNAGFDNVALNVATPEPTTLGITGLALVALGLVRRRRAG